ncbi:MAG: amino acid adenylation domain-containing protein, partial [bacterium]|nr:amino acid adenylation domain-containing protein [bacterium]
EEARRHILAVDIHHIVTDGFSMGIVVNEMMPLYNGGDLPELSVQYKDYSQWQNRSFQTGELKVQETSWKKTFEEDIPLLNLPADFSRPSVQQFEGSVFHFSTGPEMAGGIRKLALERDVTRYMLLMAVFNVFLSKLCGQEDIVVGTPIAGRRHSDLKQVIGLFVNTLAMRNFPSGEKPFEQFLNETKESALKAFENQDYPFEQLVEAVAVRRDVSRSPLFDVMFVFQDNVIGAAGIPGVEGPGLRLTPVPYAGDISKFDMTLAVYKSGDSLGLSLQYCTKLFKQETIQRFAGYFKKILSLVLEEPGKKIADIEIISPEEKNKILYEFNDTKIDYPSDKTIHGLFEDQAEKTPHKVALVYSADRSHMTYDQLNKKSGQAANVFKEKGLQPGGIVAVMLNRSIEMAVGIFGILKAGCAYLPIAPDYPRDRIEYMLADSDAKVVLSEEGVVSSIQHTSPTQLTQPIQPTQSTQPSYVIYTSGTTGRPKGVMVEHRSVVNTLLCRKEKFGMTGAQTFLQLFSQSFDGFVVSFFTPLLAGAKVILLSEEGSIDVTEIKKSIVFFRVTHFVCVPALYRAIIESLTPQESVSLEVVSLAGDRILPELVKLTARKNQNIEIAIEYGVTEAAVSSTMHRHQAQDEEITIGKPEWNTAVYILGGGNHLQPVGIPGELCIGGAGVARGYLNNPELTAEKFSPAGPAVQTLLSLYPSARLYHSGDLARWLPDGNIEFLGRIDLQVKIRGYRIEPGEIENRLLHQEEIKEAVVIDRVNSSGQKYLCAYIVSDREWTTPELRECLLKELPDYMVPTYFTRLEELPVTPNGKID